MSTPFDPSVAASSAQVQVGQLARPAQPVATSMANGGAPPAGIAAAAVQAAPARPAVEHAEQKEQASVRPQSQPLGAPAGAPVSMRFSTR